MKRRVMAVGLALCLWSRVVWATTDYVSDAGYGSLAVVCNLFYMPVKTVYAVLGGFTGSLAYLLTVGDLETAERIWTPSMGGSYVVTPKMLQNEEPIMFNGSSPDAQ